MTLPIDDIIELRNWQLHTIFISEPGLYALVTLSKKPEAVKFTKWIMEEVLPSLRRTGQYSINQTEQMDTTPSDHELCLLQKDMKIQKLRYEQQLLAKETKE